MGRWHAHAVTRAGHRIAAIIDPDVARASSLARAYPQARVAQTLADAGDIDVVHVCTPLDTHVGLCSDALARGAHVIVEKPLAADAAETETVLDRASSAGLLIVPVHQFLFQRGVLRAQRQLADIGPLIHADVTICTAGAAGKSQVEQDRVALEVLPHPLALFARLVSPRIADVRWTVRSPAPGELRVDGILDGVCVSATVSTGGRPTTNQLRLIGRRGTATVDMFHGFTVTTRGRTTRVGKIAQPFIGGASLLVNASTNLFLRTVQREPAYPGLGELVARFYSAVANHGGPPISREETLGVALALASIKTSVSRS
jgi:predicted dehydrogenase